MKNIHFLIIFCFIFTCFTHCKAKKEVIVKQKDLHIRLRWIKSYPDEKEEDMRTGFVWAMSLLGAEMPKGCMEKAFVPLKNDLYELNISGLGFSAVAQDAFYPILKALKASPEYTQKGAIDIGRFIVVTLHSSWNYYSLTNIPKTLALFQQKYPLDSASTFPVINSSVANGHRMLEFLATQAVPKMAFLAKEGEGEIEQGTFQATDFEVFDIMKNGQLRFGIYDKKGNLISASPKALGNAGKPGKCMWCHESQLQTLHSPTPDLANYMSATAFDSQMLRMNDAIIQFQQGLQTEVDWKDYSAHTRQEWLYIGFMEPNLERIAAEWEMTTEKVKAIIAHLPTHKHEEFAFFGDCYERKDIDALAPYRSVKVPSSVREPSDDEPHF
jgi:hypothetical protein